MSEQANEMSSDRQELSKYKTNDLENQEEQRLQENLKAQEGAFEDAVLRLSRFYSRTDRPMLALKYIERLNACTTEPEKKAFCYLSMGQLLEQNRDFESAIAAYAQAYLLEPVNSTSWYFIHNNLGCCLNHCERYEEAERYCREAIRIDPTRYNAYINFGVALEGQSKYADAVRAFIKAIKTNSSDTDVLQHLEDLVADHDEISSEITDITEQMEDCRQAARRRNKKSGETK
jgi:tetratricopeptide (TPR) repeat protein